MRPHLVVMPPPGFDRDRRLVPMPKPLQTEMLVAEFAVDDSSVAFCHGLPGSMCAVSMRASSSQRKIAVATNSGPLSERR